MVGEFCPFGRGVKKRAVVDKNSAFSRLRRRDMSQLAPQPSFMERGGDGEFCPGRWT
jgi:hypothetical protein